MSFVHLHTHTEYSLLDGLSKIPDLLRYVKELKQPAVAITDHGTMYGCIEFYQTAKKYDIKPILGCELYVSASSIYNDPRGSGRQKMYHLTALAKNATGYKNLMKLVSIAALDGFYYKPRIDKDILQKHSQGLLCLSGCLQGEIATLVREGLVAEATQSAQWYHEVLGSGNFFIEVQHHNIVDQAEINKKIVALAHSNHLPLVATNDIHYIKPDDAQAQDALLCIQTNALLKEKNRLSMIDSPDFYVRSTEEMKKMFAHIPEAITNTLLIAEQCNVSLDFGQSILPEFKVPKQYTNADEYLCFLCDQGIKKVFESAQFTDQYKNRLVYELQVIRTMHYAPIFLIVWDLVEFCKQRHIAIGPARGSAAASLVSYLLGITGLDPLQYQLMFERFLNPERISMPDIDIDFEDERRDEIFHYLADRYGDEHIAQIITFGSMKSRAAIRDIGRVMGLPYTFVDSIAKKIPFGASITESLDLNHDLAAVYQENSDAHTMIDLAKKVEGVARHASTHAAGVVVAREPLVEYTPLQRETGAGDKVITQYAMKPLEDIGLLKIDILGLSNLTIIKKTVELVKKRHGIAIAIEDIPLDDTKTYQLLSQGKTISVFQLESRGMQDLARNLVPTVFDDIVAMVALFRPGPMQFIDTYIRRKHGKEKVSYIHPRLERILQNTYGVIVYQEQVMHIAMELAGFTGPQADTLRKAMGKKIGHLMDQQKTAFIEGCVKNAIPHKIAQKVFSDIEQFAQYAFNKAHSVGYALIAYQSAYLKAHWPVEFFCAALSVEKGNEKKIQSIIKDCRLFGLAIVPPDILRSECDFSIEDAGDKSVIRFGLSAIKNVGEKTIDNIVNVRSQKPFASLIDFCQRIDPADINKKMLESFIKVGAFDCFGERNTLLGGIETILQFIASQAKRRSHAQQFLFSRSELEESDHLPLDTMPKVDATLLYRWEKELLGITFSPHPKAALLEKLNQVVNKKFDELPCEQKNSMVTVGGIITAISVVRTRKKQEEMAFISLEDDQGNTLEVIVFPSVYTKARAICQPNKVIYVKGKVTDQEGDVRIICEEMVEVDENVVHKDTPGALDFVIPSAHNHSVVTITVPSACSPYQLQQLKELLEQVPGKTSIRLLFAGSSEEMYLELPCMVNYSQDLQVRIDELFGQG